MAVDSGVAKTLIILTASLLFSSLMITFFLLEAYGVSAAGITLPEMAIGNYNSNQNFSSGDYNASVLDESSVYTTFFGDNWEIVTGVGMRLKPSGDDDLSGSPLAIKNLQSDSGYYSNNYHLINAEEHKDVGIMLKYCPSVPASSNIIYITKEGVSFKGRSANWLREGVDDIFYPDTAPWLADTFDISTTYNEQTASGSITINGQTYNFDKLNPGEAAPFGGTYYGGIVSGAQGFIFTSFNTQNTITKGTQPDTLSQVWIFLTAMTKLLLYNVDARYLPWVWNLALIKSQELGIFICLIVIVRG